MFQAEIHHDIKARTPSGLLLARGFLTITSFHYLNLMFRSKNHHHQQQQKTKPNNQHSPKARNGKTPADEY